MSLIIEMDRLPYLLNQTKKAALYYAQIEAIKNKKFDDNSLSEFKKYDKELPTVHSFERDLDEKEGKKGYDNPDYDIKRIVFYLYANAKTGNEKLNEDSFKYWNLIQPIFGLEYDIDHASGSFQKEMKAKIRSFLTISDRFPDYIRTILLKKVAYLFEDEPELYAKIWTEIANNSTRFEIDNKIKAFKVTKNINIARDVIEQSKRDVKTLLEEQYPDIDKIQNICKKIQSVCQIILDEIPEHAQYAKEIMQIFDFDKMIAIGQKYMPQVQQSLEERLAKAEAQVKSAEKHANEAEQRAKNEEARASRAEANYNNEKQQHQQELQAAQNKSAMLTQEMDKMQRQLDAQNLFIKNLQMKMATLKTGLFGRGMTPEELQKWIAENVPQESR